MKSFKPLLVSGLIVVAAIVAGYYIIRGEETLPVIQPSDVNPELVPESLQKKTLGHRLDTFTLKDQTGQQFTRKDTEGKILLADFFFVTCPSICPKMATQMKTVYDEFEGYDNILLLSHTVMPEHDSVPVLRRYADSLGVTPDRWKFLTGSKPEIYRLARRSYLATRSEGQGDEHDFIHTENLVLVDQKGRLRGFYDGTSPEDAQKAIRDIRLLIKESEGT